MDFINKIFWNLVFGIRFSFVGGVGGTIPPELDGGLDPETIVNPNPKEETKPAPVVTPVQPVKPVKPAPEKPDPDPDPTPDPTPIIIPDDDFVGTEPPEDSTTIDTPEIVHTPVDSLPEDPMPVGGEDVVIVTEGENPVRDPEPEAKVVETQSELLQFYNNKFTDENVMPNVDVTAINLESVSIYKAIDLISEGEIAGLCDANGSLIEFSSDIALNEDGFKGIYFNDVPVKNTNSNTLNFTRAFAEIKYGTAAQTLLSDSENPALSLRSSSQTFSASLSLAGFNEDNFYAVWDKPTIILQSHRHAQPTKTNPATAIPIIQAKGVGSGDIEFYKKSHDDYGWNVKSNSVSYFTGRGAQGGYGASWARKMDKAFQLQSVKYQHTVTNDNVTDVEIGLTVAHLFTTNKDGDMRNRSMSFGIRIGYVDDNRMLDEGGSVVYVFANFYGKATSPYVRSYNFPLPIAERGRDRQVTVINLNKEPKPTWTRYNVAGGVSYISEVVKRNLSYPHSAIMGTIVDARAFSAVPKRTFDMKLGKVKLPVNYDPNTREYEGNWTGELTANKYWSNNPAWIFYDLVTNPRYGLGKYGFGASVLDKWNLYSIGKYCDELVETGFRPSIAPLDFTISQGGGIATIDDSDALRGKEFFEKAGFVQNATVCIYKLKNSEGTDIPFAFRRRISLVELGYDSTPGSQRFRFHLLKEISPEYIFNKYVDDTESPYGPWLKDAYSASTEGIGAWEWLLNYIGANYPSKDTEGFRKQATQFINEYTTQFPIGNRVTEGQVAVDQINSSARPLLEPRFTTNVYLDREQEAYNALNDLAAVFRGMLYWNNGFVFVSNDQTREAVLLFNNTNVKEGVFNYSGTAKTTRFTSVLVRYNDEHDNFKPKVEYVEDAAGIRKFGHLEKKLIALGCTSRSQAHRLGKWFLFTNQTESDLIQFSAGTEATYLRPSDVIKVQDQLKNVKRYGGRIIDIDHASYTVTLDQGVAEDVVGQKLTLIVPRASKSVQDINLMAKEKAAAATPTQPFGGVDQNTIDQTRMSQIKQFTVASVAVNEGKEGGPSNQITIEAPTGLEAAANEFSAVQKGTVWSLQNTSSAYEIEEIEYRVLSVVEQSQGEYQVTALLYNRSKFNAIDLAKNLTPTQASKAEITIVVDSERPEAIDGSGAIAVWMDQDLGQYTYDASFADTTSVRDRALKVDFTSLTQTFTHENTGGYLVDIYLNGENRQITLKGVKATTFRVFLGPIDSINKVSYSVYRFNADYVLQTTGQPGD